MTDAAGNELNPLAFLIFCPHCVLSGVFALAATGVVTLPALFGVPLHYYLAPAAIVGGFLTWIAWGARARARGEARQACRAGCSATPPPRDEAAPR